jgi:IS5 family transposase
MIIDRYERPVGIVAPRVSDPILQEMDVILDDPALLALVRRDLQRHYKRSRRGRRPVPVEVTLRMVALRRRKKWSYRQAEQEVRDSPAYRWWVRVYAHRVPDHTTLNDLERVIRPETLHQINDRLLCLAQAARLTGGTQLRVDSSVTESHMHYPTDSSLLADGVRVLSRGLKHARPWLIAQLPRDVFASHTRSARQRARHIARLSRPASARAGRADNGEGKKSPETDLFRADRHRPRQCRTSLAGEPSLVLYSG